MSTTFRIASNTLYQLIAKAVSVLSTVMATALITRSLGVPAFGAFFLMTGFATYFFLLLDFGINTVAIREVTVEKSFVSKYFSSILSLRLLFSVVLMIVLAFLLPFIPFRLEGYPLLRGGIFIGLLALISQAVYNSCTVVFQSSLNYQKTIISSVIGNLAFLILAVLIIFYWPKIIFLVAANTLGTFLVALSTLYLARQMIGRVVLSFDLKLWKSLFASALPLGITVFLTVVTAKADSFLLSVMKFSPSVGMSNAEALGYYGLAYKIFENILVFPTYFVNALFPVMVLHKKIGFPKLAETLVRSLTVIFLISLIVTLLGYWLSPLVILILSGQGEGSPAVPALRLLILGLPFFFCSAVLMFFLITSGQERKLPWIYLSAAFFNVTLNVQLIPRFGFIASALLTGVTEVIILLLLVLVTFTSLRSMRAPHAEV